MKYLWIAIGLVSMLSCKPNQMVFPEQKADITLTKCPENGTCKLEISKNKTLNLLRDNFGELYPSVIEGDKVVLKFEYKRGEIINISDSSYTEQIFIEIDSSNLEIETTNFKSVKLLFARLCFCKGQTGYYKIKNGKLSIKKIKDNNYLLNLDFKVEEVPQIITNVTQIFSLNQ